MAGKIPVVPYGGPTQTPPQQHIPPEAVTTATGRPGYDYDPYDSPGERAEGMFVGAIINKVLKLVGMSDPSGFCSTYREWHILLAGVSDGFRAPTLGQVPDCPPLWRDEAQYYNSAAMAANVLKCQWPTVAVVLTGAAAKVSGVL